jgi:hypothetical protein
MEESLEEKLIIFLKNSFVCPSSVYATFLNFVDISNLRLEKIREDFKKNTNLVPIFQKEEENDMLRKQLLLKKRNLKNLGLKAIDEKVKMFFKHPLFKNEDFKLCATLLVSEENCSTQRLHTDYSTEQKHLEATNSSFIILIALYNNTKLNFVDKDNNQNQILINAGDLFIARGSFLHAGAAYSTFNMRIHYYVDCHQSKRVENTTYYVDKNFVEHKIELQYRAYYAARVKNMNTVNSKRKIKTIQNQKIQKVKKIFNKKLDSNNLQVYKNKSLIARITNTLQEKKKEKQILLSKIKINLKYQKANFNC